ncbi:dTDP-4-dehydrorhamnose reductase [Aneurinibacillus sp. Ricciae_BoGa-3]|uniref:dTDP-4-dehydrorhamnose reductase n=1 Tax=Aneurinibacillus sp. Ricciae_BoGa-3 TaxID=3022697 RepID=UPI0023411225|nr:dTDP-4-dehydrorhamnose reductase [Aneurinibacillus sp. Ricciae_BoGa-3]WCK54287.1 dTDP-4-dehydrorhamnose reductase [Aneurinibacillus sp. Ricciae_BoGa-3]
MKVLITGGKGQLGTDVARILQEQGHEVYALGRDQLDITLLKETISTISEMKPDVIVHTAAYTKVDAAEEQVDQAYLVNAIGTRNIAIAADKVKAKLVHISTDYVFRGDVETPYREFDSTDPLTMYGKSKLAGEVFVRDFCKHYFILRTSWVYGKHGQNFVKTMLKLAETRSELNVVFDQVGSPTYTVDLARFILQIMETECYGTYHVSDSGHCSWYEFAREIFELAGKDIKVNPVTTAEFPRPAPRPAYSVMDHMMIRLNRLPDLPSWQAGLRSFMEEIRED